MLHFFSNNFVSYYKKVIFSELNNAIKQIVLISTINGKVTASTTSSCSLPGQGTGKHPHGCVRLQFSKAQLVEATDFGNISKNPQSN